jgi:RNA polymerase sigma-70 factor (ECF subfamily)
MNGNRDLFWQLVEPEHRQAQAYCRKLTGNTQDGEDVYHDALIAALRGFGRLRSRQSFRPWLYRIIINTYRNRIRSPWWRRLVPLGGDETGRLAGDNPGPRLAARRRLEIAFAAVSPEEKALVVLSDLDGWKLADLAEMTNRTEAAVKMRLSRARRRMREAVVKHLSGNSSTVISNAKLVEDTVCVVTKPAKE